MAQRYLFVGYTSVYFGMLYKCLVCMVQKSLLCMVQKYLCMLQNLYRSPISHFSDGAIDMKDDDDNDLVIDASQ